MKLKCIASMVVVFLLCSGLFFSQVKVQPLNVQKKTVYLPHEKLSLKKLPLIKFNPFKLSDFHVDSAEKTVRLRNGKVLGADEFLREVNNLEERLNAWGYTLRDNKTVKVHFIYPKEKLKFQKEYLMRGAKVVQKPLTCEQDTSAERSIEIPSGRPKDFVPLDWQGNWNVLYGDGDFGVELTAQLKMEGKEARLDISPYFDAKIFLLGNTLGILQIEKRENKLVGRVPVMQREYTMPANQLPEKELLNEAIQWSTDIGFSIGPLDVTGMVGLSGKADLVGSWRLDHYNRKASAHFYPSLSVRAYGDLKTDFRIADAGIDGEITFLEDTAALNGELKYISSPNRIFELSADGHTKATLIRGRLLAYVEIDYLIGSKKFEIELYADEGIHLERPLFSIHDSMPAEKDHQAWLKINRISGVTDVTARNEKTHVQSKEFDVVVGIGGRNYRTTLKDLNKDGRYGEAFGEYHPIRFEIPLFSFQKVPISIEVIQKYNIGAFPLQNALDLAPDSGGMLDICYDPKTRTFSGTKSGKENEGIRSVGNTSYWGERFHSIDLELTSGSGFESAPAKAK